MNQNCVEILWPQSEFADRNAPFRVLTRKWPPLCGPPWAVTDALNSAAQGMEPASLLVMRHHWLETDGPQMGILAALVFDLRALSYFGSYQSI